MTESWRSRIVGHGEEAPDQLLANPRNWRIHPKAQQDALAGVLDAVGWVQDIIVNRQTGHVVDGHLRVSLAISRGEAAVPVIYVDLAPDEEALVLASLDPLAAMAVTDQEQLAELLGGITPEGALAELLGGLVGDVGEVGFPALPDGDRGEFRSMTFTVTAAQQEMVHEALARAKQEAGDADTGNQNSNGNALARICVEYLR